MWTSVRGEATGIGGASPASARASTTPASLAASSVNDASSSRTLGFVGSGAEGVGWLNRYWNATVPFSHATFGGYLVTRAGRLPLRGQIIPGPDLFEFEVLDADPRRVKRVRIIRLTERRERSRKRGEPDAVLAGTTPPVLAVDDAPAPKDTAPLAAVPAKSKRP